MIDFEDRSNRQSSSGGEGAEIYDSVIRSYSREIRTFCWALSQRQMWLMGILSFNVLSLAVLAAVSTMNLIFIFPALVSAIFCFGTIFELRRTATEILSVKPMLRSVIHLQERSNQIRRNSGRASVDTQITSVDVEWAIRAHAALDPASEGAKSVFRLLVPE